MNVISVALSRINQEIPQEVLQEAFAPRRYDPSRRQSYRDNQLGVSIDSAVRREVIDGRVAVDINLNSGVETTIPLQGIEREIIDPWNVIFRIPKAYTGNRNITVVYSVSYGNSFAVAGAGGNIGTASPMLEAAAGLYQAEAPMAVTSTANVTLVGDNTILINDINSIPGFLYLRCLLTHEPNFANLQPPYYHHFCELAILATKAVIYNKIVINLDEGQIKAGSTIGRFREIVDGYADAWQQYKDYLKDTWRKVAILSDIEKKRRWLRLTVGGRR